MATETLMAVIDLSQISEDISQLHLEVGLLLQDAYRLGETAVYSMIVSNQ